MVQIKHFNFEQFRRWFNARFSLSLNGKFAGLSRLLTDERLFEAFKARLCKVLNSYASGYLCHSQVISFKFHSQSVKLYDR